MNIYIHILTVILPLAKRCYHCKAFVTVTSLRRSVSYFIAHSFCQSATACDKGAAPSSAEEMPIEPGLCTTHTLGTPCQPQACCIFLFVKNTTAPQQRDRQIITRLEHLVRQLVHI